MTSLPVYFPNLNGLRFIAAFLVILHHLENWKYFLGLPNVANSRMILIGQLGVILFFVLSGFLITFLLLSEEKLTSRISIRHFYTRRILRIWPLYFLLLFIGLFLLPHITFFQIRMGTMFQLVETMNQLFLFLFFLPNLSLVLYGAVPFIGQLWSVGAEEQFYLIWPWVLRYFKKARVLVFIIFLVGICLLKVLSTFVPADYGGKILVRFLFYLPLESMVIGAIMAVLAKGSIEWVKKCLFHPLIQLSVVACIVIGCYVNMHFVFAGVNWNYLIFGGLFAVAIFNLALNPKVLIPLEFGVLNYLGKISYSIYMLHPLAIFLAIRMLIGFNMADNILIFIFTMIFTLSFSVISYELFEKRFIRLKKKYSKIHGQEDVRISTL